MIQTAMLLISLSKKEKAGTITPAERKQLADARGTVLTNVTPMKVSDPFGLLR